ncbi:MAG: cytochrome c3 family protein [Deltaproteobacteria bacterium]|nr:cytochrome c3 family protein [Deltaproteobacteria bacterium]
MKYANSFFAIAIVLIIQTAAWAADDIGSLINPGDLASAHSKYEGIKNCTKCHRLRGGIPDNNCLDCHEKLAKQIASRRGVHAKYTDPCIKCHTDHKGRDFKIISFDKDKFDHGRTDYPLKDRHARVDCAKCHKKTGVYGGLSTECVSCHTDAHKKQLSEDCSRCHNIAGWKDTGRFNHNLGSAYALTGRHTDVKCIKCHSQGRYKPLEYKSCKDCHKDVHKGQFKDRTCESCHSVNGWKTTSFDHNSAGYNGYKLEGKHLKTPCDKCHQQGKFKPLAYKTCKDCHNDVHKGQFKDRTCESCHSVNDWKTTSFDHNSPEYKGYKLEGKHLKTPCAKCHQQGKFKPLAYKTCKDCHNDVHKGQFKDRTCESCHSVNGWKATSFDHNSAEYKGYKLEGKHLKTPCDKCHQQGKFKPLAYKTCKDCHNDVHKGQFKDRTCESCHSVNGWKATSFDHNSPEYKGYKLEGKHLKTPCDKCHQQEKYRPVDTACKSCHAKDDTHKNELGALCDKCHTANDWKKTTLRHNTQTRFPLIGKHTDTPCEKCHTNKRYKSKDDKCADCHKDVHKGKFKEECGSCHTQVDWAPRKFDHRKMTGYALGGVHNDILCANCHTAKDDYRKVNRYCGQCHVDPHLNQFGMMDCEKCHGQSSWNPVAFRHSGTGFPLTGQHRAAECSSCHKNRIYRNTLTICYNCHAQQYASAPNHLARSYSRDCTQCHDTFFNSWNFSHRSINSGCSTCHLNSRPSSHTANPTMYPTTCESCHTSTTTWSAHSHITASTGCATCHLNSRPSSHTADPTMYPTTCESCHTSTTTWSAHSHTTASTGCSTCHLNSRPSSHTADTVKYPITCELCHNSTTTWTSHQHTSTSGCSTCHINARPSTHTANPTRYTTTCETCHKYPTWTFSHSTVSTTCSTCHSTDAPAAHLTYSAYFGTSCQNCHTYPAWTTATINHSSFTTFPTSHKGYSKCSDCHPTQQYNNGYCIECHTAHGAKVHNTTSNSSCLACHPTGTAKRLR